MIPNNKKLLIITSLLTLLPIPVGMVLMNRFPETMAIHFGFTGQADGYASPNFAVFVPPVIMLTVQWVLILISRLDKSNHGKNKKIQQLVLWIIPALSNLSMLGIYALALEADFSPVAWTMVFMGLLFALIGNYLPKTRMNATIGIKISTTYTSDENWNATHRLAGKLWVAGGIGIALCWWLPNSWAMIVLFTVLTVMILIPLVYSHRFYKRELAEGKELKNSRHYADPKAKKTSIVFMVVLLAFLSVILFTGDIRYDFQEDHLLVKADMYTDYILRYERIDAVEYREENMPGLRVGGFGSFRLLMGFFENDEFGTYTRYTYYNPESCVVVTAGSNTIVLSGEDAAATQQLYQTLLTKTNN